MTSLRTHAWRLALVASGLAMLVGGPMHPASDGRDSLREELATMTADPAWVPAHAFVVLSTLLLAAGLWTAYRRGAWPPAARRALGLAAVAVSLYAVETVFHLASVADRHALEHGGAAPVAYTHLGLSVVLYPVTGLAIAYLALTYGRVSGGARWAVAALGIAGGLAHALSVPLTFILPRTELSPLFASAAILIAAWSIATGAAGIRRDATVGGGRVRQPVG